MVTLQLCNRQSKYYLRDLGFLEEGNGMLYFVRSPSTSKHEMGMFICVFGKVSKSTIHELVSMQN